MPRPKGSKNKTKAPKEPTAPKGDATPPPTATGTVEGAPESTKADEQVAAPATETATKPPQATDLEKQAAEKQDGDLWNGAKLLSRRIRIEDIEVERPIVAQDRLGYADRLGMLDQQMDMLDKERKATLAEFGERKAKLIEDRADALNAVLKSTMRKYIPHEVRADYENGIMTWTSLDTKIMLDHKTRPLMEGELQSALPVGDRTKVQPLRLVKEGEEGKESESEKPTYGSKRWIKAKLPGFECFKEELDWWIEKFTRGMVELGKETPPREQFTENELKLITEAGRVELAKIAEKKRLEELAANPPATTSDGGTAATPVRYEDDPDHPGQCKWCSSEEFDHNLKGEEPNQALFCKPKEDAATA